MANLQTIIEFPPFQTPLIDGPGAKMQRNWSDWFQLVLLPRLQSTAAATASATATAQNASIGTEVLIAAAQAGVYRVNVNVKVDVVDGVSSAIQVNILNTQNGVTVTQSTDNVTGDTTASLTSRVFVVVADSGTPISYSTTYASNTPNKMEYELAITVEQL